MHTKWNTQSAVVSLSVCLLFTFVSRAKTAERIEMIEMLFGGLTRMEWSNGHKEPVLVGRPNLSRERSIFRWLSALLKKHWEPFQRCKQIWQIRSRCRLEANSRWRKEACIRPGQGWKNPFTTARGEKTAMRPFVKLIWPLVIIVIIIIVIIIVVAVVLPLSSLL